MNTNRDRLDAAIDAVAGRLTHVNEDAGLALRIVKALPQRPAWSLHWLMPRLAVTALLAMATAIVVLRTFDERSTGVGPAKAGHHSASVTPAEPGTVGVGPGDIEPRRISVESAFRRTSSGTTTDPPDHERSLAPIDAPDALLLTALTPSELASEPVREIEPLQIADLPLSLDFPPR